MNAGSVLKDSSSAKFSPTGTHFAAFPSAQEIGIFDVDSRLCCAIHAPHTVMFTWARDGQSLVLVHSLGNSDFGDGISLVRACARTGSTLTSVVLVSSFVHMVSLSPYGEYVYHTKSNLACPPRFDFVVQKAAGDIILQESLFPSNHRPGFAVWHPQDGAVVFLDSSAALPLIKGICLTDGCCLFSCEAAPLSYIADWTGSLLLLDVPSSSPGSSSLLEITRPGGDQCSGTQALLLASRPDKVCLAHSCSPDGRFLAANIAGLQARGIVFDLGSGQECYRTGVPLLPQASAGVPHYCWRFSWSPCCRWLACYLTEGPQSESWRYQRVPQHVRPRTPPCWVVYIVSIITWKQTAAIRAPAGMYRVAWSPDGSSILLQTIGPQFVQLVKFEQPSKQARSRGHTRQPANLRARLAACFSRPSVQ